MIPASARCSECCSRYNVKSLIEVCMLDNLVNHRHDVT